MKTSAEELTGSRRGYGSENAIQPSPESFTLTGGVKRPLPPFLRSSIM